jgi:hypothetical protein
MWLWRMWLWIRILIAPNCAFETDAVQRRALHGAAQRIVGHLGLATRAHSAFVINFSRRGMSMLYYLNNWRNSDHARIYGGIAIYDLWADGVQDKRARAMSPGDTCLILSPSGKLNVTVSRHILSRVFRGPDDSSTKRGVWVLEGTLVSRETLSKAAAAEHPEYRRFFNKRGHVCQWSVLQDAQPRVRDGRSSAPRASRRRSTR